MPGHVERFVIFDCLCTVGSIIYIAGENLLLCSCMRYCLRKLCFSLILDSPVIILQKNIKSVHLLSSKGLFGCCKYIILFSHGVGVIDTTEENSALFSLIQMYQFAVSKGMWAVKHCFNMLQFFSRGRCQPMQVDLCNGNKMVTVVLFQWHLAFLLACSLDWQYWV